MITLLLHPLRLLPFLCGGHRQLALENLALRQQLAVYKRTANRPKLQPADRRSWVWLSRVGPAWRQALVIVAPATVLRWQRRRFRRHWATLSGHRPAGHPPVDAAIKALVRRMATANPLWGAPRIQGELLKLGMVRCRAHRLPPAPEAPLTAVADVAHVPDQSRPGPRLHRFLHCSHRALACSVRLRRARPRPPPRPPLQCHRASHRRLDGPADRGRLPGRLRPVLSPPRSRLGLRSRVPATREGHGCW